MVDDSAGEMIRYYTVAGKRAASPYPFGTRRVLMPLKQPSPDLLR
jgi:hypothetical protein